MVIKHSTDKKIINKNQFPRFILEVKAAAKGGQWQDIYTEANTQKSPNFPIFL